MSDWMSIYAIAEQKPKILHDSDSKNGICHIGHKMGHTSTCLPLKVDIIMTFKPNEKRSKCLHTTVIP